MAKKSKRPKEKMPKVTKISQEQMDNFLAAIMDSNISAEYNTANLITPPPQLPYIQPGVSAFSGTLLVYV